MKLTKQDIDKRERAIQSFMHVDHAPVDYMSWDRLMAIKAKIESEGRSNEVIIGKKECRIFYANSKKRIHHKGVTTKEALWLAVAEYCLEQGFTTNVPV